MRSLVTSKTLLFLGFSFTDEYLEELRSQCLALLVGSNKRKKKGRVAADRHAVESQVPKLLDNEVAKATEAARRIIIDSASAPTEGEGNGDDGDGDSDNDDEDSGAGTFGRSSSSDGSSGGGGGGGGGGSGGGGGGSLHHSASFSARGESAPGTATKRPSASGILPQPLGFAIMERPQLADGDRNLDVGDAKLLEYYRRHEGLAYGIACDIC